MLYFTRRAFLRTGGMGAAGIALGGRLEKLVHALEREGDLNHFRRAIRPFSTIPTVCLQCQAGCGVLGLVVDDELIGILGNPGYPTNQGGICARAAAGINLIDDPERVLYPVKRKGKRGGNQWQRISWKEALREISSRLAALRSKGQTDQFVVQKGVDEGYTPIQSLLKGMGRPTLIDDFYLRNLSSIKGHEIVWGEGLGYPDVSHSTYMLNFGANPYESHEFHIPFAQRIVSSRRKNKASLITFDVRLSNTAGLSDKWYPLRPGTDGAVILAMCKVILENDLEDSGFLSQWSNSSKEQILSHLSPYTPQMAEDVSGVNKEDILRLARDFAHFRPSVAFGGMGLTGHRSGTYNQMALLLLNALIGNIDEKGGYCLPRRYVLEEPQVGSIDYDLDALIRKRKVPVSLYMTYLSNPVYSQPSGRYVEEILNDEKLIPFYVAADTHVTETSMFADIVLPVATGFESWGLEARPAMDMVPYLGLRQPVVRPRGEALPFPNILAGIGKGAGVVSDCAFFDYMKRLLIKVNRFAGEKDLRHLRTGGYWFDPNLSPRYRSYREQSFPTPSGKMELYSGVLEKEGYSPLPVYEALDERADAKEGKLFLTTFTVNVAAKRNPNSKWLSEIFHENPLWMNEKTAKTLRITDGEKVEISSEKGKAVVFVRLTQAIHPEVVAISDNLGHWAYGHVAKAQEAKSPDRDISRIWWGNSKSFHVTWLLGDAADRISNGKGTCGTLIRVTKTG